MKALIVVAHPHFEHSRIGRAWVDAIHAAGDIATIHPIASYAHGMRPEHIKSEQALIEQHDAVIIQFPLYDFYMPAVGKIWLDEVFSWGWAFGPADRPEQNRMAGMKIAAAVSCGCKPADFAEGGMIGIPLESCVSALPAFCRYGRARWCGMHTLYGAEGSLPDADVLANAQEYVRFVQGVLAA